MYLKTKGIIIKIRDFSENDLLIDIFTLKSGKVTVIAKGAKNAKSKISSVSNLFIYGEFNLYIGKKWNRINSVEIIKSFYYIREDIEKLAYGSYFLEVVGASIIEKRVDREIFILLLKTLDSLKTDKYLLLKVLFEFNLMSYLGYSPILGQCASCNKDLTSNISFSVYHGGVLCQNCKNKNSLNISNKLLKILQFFQTNKFYDILEIEINELFLKKLDILLYKYLVYYLEKSNFKSLKFLNTLKGV